MDDDDRPKTDGERVEDLEVLVAHQARTIDELSDVVASHGDVISDLRRKIDVLTRRTAEAESRLSDIVPVDKPPHW
ncbi:MAG: SlyX family protein [Pseudomonadota bacterium]